MSNNEQKSTFTYLVNKDVFGMPLLVWAFIAVLIVLAMMTMSDVTIDDKPVPTQIRYTQQDPSQQTEVLYSIVVDGKVTNVTGIEYAMILLKQNEVLIAQKNEMYVRDLKQRTREEQLNQDDQMNQAALTQKYKDALAAKYQEYLDDLNKQAREHEKALLDQRIMYENQKIEIIKQCQN